MCRWRNEALPVCMIPPMPERASCNDRCQWIANNNASVAAISLSAQVLPAQCLPALLASSQRGQSPSDTTVDQTGGLLSLA